MKKCYISLTDDMMDRIDKLAGYFGVTRSAYIAMVLGQAVTSTEQVYQAIPASMTQTITKAISKK